MEVAPIRLNYTVAVLCQFMAVLFIYLLPIYLFIVTGLVPFTRNTVFDNRPCPHDCYFYPSPPSTITIYSLLLYLPAVNCVKHKFCTFQIIGIINKLSNFKRPCGRKYATNFAVFALLEANKRVPFAQLLVIEKF